MSSLQRGSISFPLLACSCTHISSTVLTLCLYPSHSLCSHLSIYEWVEGQPFAARVTGALICLHPGGWLAGMTCSLTSGALCFCCCTRIYATPWTVPGSSVHRNSPGKNTGVGCHFFSDHQTSDFFLLLLCCLFNSGSKPILLRCLLPLGLGRPPTAEVLLSTRQALPSF